MKKLSFIVMPLLAVSFLASCERPDVSHTFHFLGTNCTINGENDYSHDIFEKDKNVNYTIVPDEGYKLPETVEGIDYDPTNGVITINEIKDNIELRVEATHIPQPGVTHTIHLDSAGGTITGDTILKDLRDNYPVETAPIISRVGYDATEVKWYTKPNGEGEEFKFGPEGTGTPVVKDYFLHAKWGDIKTYTVKFYDGTTKYDLDQTVKYGEKVQRPVSPTKEGYTFDNWYTTDGGDDLYPFDTPLTTGVSAEVNIYAKFNLNNCHITYITNGGTLGDSHIDSVEYGGTITTAPDITREGYDEKQVKWYSSPSFEEKDEFKFGAAGTGTQVKSDINLYAKWGNIKTYTVKFYDGTTKYDLDQTVKYGEKVQRPVSPTKEGYTFDNWYTTDGGDDLYPFDIPLTTGVSAEVNIYAKFNLNNCHITYIISGYTITSSIDSVGYGATIPTEPTVKIGDKQIYPTWWTTPTFTEDSQFTFGEAGTGDPVKGDLILYGKYSPTEDLAISMVVSVDNNETISFSSASTDSFAVDWGDGTINSERSHTYTSSFVYTIKIIGELNDFEYTSVDKKTIQVIDVQNKASLHSTAFCDCTELWLVKLNNNLNEIGLSTFRNCSSLTSVTIPSSVTSIGQTAFRDCTKLSTLTFSEGSSLTTFGKGAFSNCSSLTSVTIPSSVKSIGEDAFRDCAKLSTLNFSGNSSLETIGKNAFNNCSSLTSVTIPSSVKSIGEYAYFYCTKLSTLNFSGNSSLETIGKSAFSNCSSLTSVTIPSSVKSIGENVFSQCTSLQTINLTAFTSTESVPASSVSTFSGIHSDAKFYVYSEPMRDAFIAKGKSGQGWPTSTNSYVIGQPSSGI